MGDWGIGVIWAPKTLADLKIRTGFCFCFCFYFPRLTMKIKPQFGFKRFEFRFCAQCIWSLYLIDFRCFFHLHFGLRSLVSGLWSLVYRLYSLWSVWHLFVGWPPWISPVSKVVSLIYSNCSDAA